MEESTQTGGDKRKVCVLLLKWEILKDAYVLTLGSCPEKEGNPGDAGDQEGAWRYSASEMLEGTRSEHKWRTCVLEDLKHLSEQLRQKKWACVLGGFWWEKWRILPVGPQFLKENGQGFEVRVKMEEQREQKICRITVKSLSHWRMGEQAISERRKEDYWWCWTHRRLLSILLKVGAYAVCLLPTSPVDTNSMKAGPGSIVLTFFLPILGFETLPALYWGEGMNKWMNECLMAPSRPSTADVNDGFPHYRWVFWRDKGTGFVLQRVVTKQ